MKEEQPSYLSGDDEDGDQVFQGDGEVLSVLADSSSPYGEVALSRSQFSRIVDTKGGRVPGLSSYNQYRGLHVDAIGSAINKKARTLVNQFGVDSQLQTRISESATRLATKIVKTKRMSTVEAVIVSVALEFKQRGRSLGDISSRMSGVYSWLASAGFVELLVQSKEPSKIKVFVDDQPRKFKLLEFGSGWKLVVPAFMTDIHVEVRVQGATFVQSTVLPKSLTVTGPHTARLAVRGKNYELFKLLKAAQLDAGVGYPEQDVSRLLARYSLDKLARTSELLQKVGCAREFNGAYVDRLRAKLSDGEGKTPKQLAIDALGETEAEFLRALAQPQKSYARVWALASLPSNDVRDIGQGSLKVKADLAAWED